MSNTFFEGLESYCAIPVEPISSSLYRVASRIADYSGPPDRIVERVVDVSMYPQADIFRDIDIRKIPVIGTSLPLEAWVYRSPVWGHMGNHDIRSALVEGVQSRSVSPHGFVWRHAPDHTVIIQIAPDSLLGEWASIVHIRPEDSPKESKSPEIIISIVQIGHSMLGVETA